MATPHQAVSKIPQVTLLFWIMKTCATTLGETAGDLLSMTLDVGYFASTLILLAAFLVSVIIQLRARTYQPVLYWLVILTTSTGGTTMSDFMDRTLGLGYALGSLILLCMLSGVLAFWWSTGDSLSVSDIRSRRVEVYYWTAILFSNTLGTALGDFLADDSGLGFAGGALVIGALLMLVATAYATTRVSRVVLFWAAFVLTRPFGATFGDVLTKSHAKGGLDLGTLGSSAVLFSILAVLVAYTMVAQRGAVGAAGLQGSE